MDGVVQAIGRPRRVRRQKGRQRRLRASRQRFRLCRTHWRVKPKDGPFVRGGIHRPRRSWSGGSCRSRFSPALGQRFQLGVIDEAHAPGDFFKQPISSLAVLNDLHKLRRLHQRSMRSRVEPRHSTVQHPHVKLPGFQVRLVHVGDFVFPTGTGRRLWAISTTSLS